MAVLALQCRSPHDHREVADLVTQFVQARKQPSDAAFDIADVSIDGETRRSVVARQQTRLTYHVTVPKHSTLRVAVAVHPDVWNEPGGSVMFLVGVSDGHWYQTKVSVTLEPFTRAADRHWRDIVVDLEEFAGLTVDIVLNTRVGGTAGAKDQEYAAVWGAPIVMLR